MFIKKVRKYYNVFGTDTFHSTSLMSYRSSRMSKAANFVNKFNFLSFSAKIKQSSNTCKSKQDNKILSWFFEG